MNREQLIEKVAARSGLSKKAAGQAVATAVELITQALKEDGSVELQGFGSLKVHERAERKGTNPATGEEITIAAKKVVRFKPGKSLAAAVAG